MTLMRARNAGPVEMSQFVLYHLGLHGFNINGLIKTATKFDCLKYIENGGGLLFGVRCAV